MSRPTIRTVAHVDTADYADVATVERSAATPNRVTLHLEPAGNGSGSAIVDLTPDETVTLAVALMNAAAAIDPDAWQRTTAALRAAANPAA